MEEDASLFPKKLLDDAPLVEDETAEPEDPEFVLGPVPGEAENEADPGSSCPGKEQNADKRKQRPAVQDRMQASLLRRDLSHLDQLHEEKDLFIQNTREELRACRWRMGLLAKQQESVAAGPAVERAAGNRSAVWHMEIQERQLEDARESAQAEAPAARKCLRERGASGKAERNRLLRVRRSVYLQKEHGLRHQKLVEDAQKNHRKAVKFLKASLGRIRKQEQREELESREHARRRMDAVLALKNSISANRETLRKFQAWGQAKAELAEQRAQAKKEVILAQGGDAFKHFCHQRRRQELEAQNRAFEEEQKLRKHEIVSRILKEEARRKQRPSPARPAGRPILRDQTWSYVAAFHDGKGPADPPCCPPEGRSALPQASLLVKAASSESVQADRGSLGREAGTLAQPEIPGLWKEDCKPYQVPKEDVDQKSVGGTKTDKDILARTAQQLCRGVTHKQVASRREFRGCPFHSKPKLVHFKDFDIGKVYKKKITLINATYTINYCKLVGVEERLGDFIHIDFDPPGPMPAGMSCEVLVTFKPTVNKDLEGNVSFLAQTGRFSVPLKCSAKKCSLSLDKELIDFGSCVVGETASRTVTLTNLGGLGTGFRFLLASECCEMDTSPSVFSTSSNFTYEDKGFDSNVATSFSKQLTAGNESVPADVPSQKESGKLDIKEKEEGRPVESEGVTSTTIVTVPPNEEQTEFSLGEITEGEIGPFSTIKVPVIFTPIVPGTVSTRFKVVFKNQQCPTLYFKVVGVAIDVPVWVPKPNVDLKICMYDRLYQDSILVHTRSKTALRLHFEVCKGLQGHLELLPKTACIQALSSYSVRLKFLPRRSLPEDAGKYFDKESRVLEAPMTIRVADQIKPVGFTVHAIVTTSDLELSPSGVDFGYCTIYEAIRTQVSLCNHSLLPQEFGFVRLPKFVDIQPNDGFGTILPLETLQLDVIFQPTKAKEYNFELVCKSEINRCFKLTCRAVGVHPLLELSHYQVKFAATSLYNTSVATLYVINSRLSMNPPTPSVPRIGLEDTPPVGPTSFEFLLPPDSPITISPAVGTVWPGKRCLVRVAFRPVLTRELIHQEALQALTKEAEAKSDTATQRKDQQRQSSILRMQNRDRLSQASASQPLELQKEDLTSSSQEYQAAQATLTRSFQGKFDKFVVPCVVASGDTKDRKGTEPLSFSAHSTVYLELWCPAVAPSIVVTSDKGKTIADFGDIAVGQRGIKKVSIQNISPERLDLEYSVLNPNGPFVLLNPIGKLVSGETQVLELSFSPRESVLAREMLEVITKRGTLSLALVGTGVASMTTCSIEGGVLNMGYVIAGESTSAGFKLQNDSPLPIKFSMQLDSLSTGSGDEHRLPQFLASPAQRTEVVGTQNYSGQSVFSVVPVEGVMEPGRAQDFTVTFSPDHESLYFSDRLQVVLFEKKISHQILLKGSARKHMMFVEGGDPLDVPVESLTVIPALDPERTEEAEELKPILVTLAYVQLDTDTPAPPATRELQVGCIRTTQPSPKKTVEFSLDSIASLQHKGFTIEPSKGSVERGQTKTISISWTPPIDFDPDHPLMVSALLQLRGDVKETYKVLFVARVVTGP
ncbi:cilia- and flagella-associated protein 74 isoform X1 [Globicephala melas]|uniref:cilia- and flagella-associated protein 74 isoform X1 n=1 Tax=Globicephala melas TaxID=9731 RepID=UPI00293D6297|nr:cilia- and flagella-associated protein 74 isoform X1 [Globicephala melas]XP_060140150.1 cilia- and flagella-associated protein 74 isoform X1 [Globicephala melas]XP_060140153.1 cilia- and flagella-associated protein 74 isoform X1 [Globicephala melas]